jgi:hypothetical protein
MLQGGIARTTNNRMEVTAANRRTACADQALRGRGRHRFRLPSLWDDGVPATLAVQLVEGVVWKPSPQSGSVGGN